ncbi:MAG TPA: hypothetical protein VNO14_18760 [Blastocatellia bacterium]|nr:hypothetical protein [Blastocatellia bacterium]
MNKKTVRLISLFVSVAGTLVFFIQEAAAGPPLLCHPLEIGGAKSLPWGSGKGWQSIDTRYDTARLADDTVALLDAGAPIIVRMETLRRATVYAMRDHAVAASLHSRLAARAREAGSSEAALALFDLGYLEETYKQASPVSGLNGSLTGHEGYSSVVRAIKMRGGDAEMEFAAALIAVHPRRSSQEEHLRRALDGAVPGSLLARNIVSHFNYRGRSIEDIRSSLRAAKN